MKEFKLKVKTCGECPGLSLAKGNTYYCLFWKLIKFEGGADLWDLDKADADKLKLCKLKEIILRVKE